MIMKKKYLFVSVFLLIIGIRTANANCFSNYESADAAAQSARYSSMSSIVWGTFWNTVWAWAGGIPGNWAAAGGATYNASQVGSVYGQISSIDSQYWNSISGAIGALNRCLGN